MRIQRSCFALCALAAGLVGPLQADQPPWHQVKIEGGSVGEVFEFPDVAFAQVGRQIFRLRDEAAAWERLPAGAGTLVLAEPSFLLVQRGLDHVRSRDDGASWEQLPFPIAQGRFQSRNVARDPISGALFLAHWRQQVGTVPMLWRSTDDGVTWQEVATLRDSPNFFRLVVVGSRIFLFRFTEIDRSDDGGATFVTIAEADLPPTIISPEEPRVRTRDHVDPFDADTIYRMGVAAEPFDVQSLYKTTNAGEDWQSVASFPASVVDLDLDATVSGRILVATANSLFESLDGGETWRSLSTPPQDPLDISRVVTGLDADTLWVGVQPEEGVFVTRDRGETWARMNQGLHAVAAFRVAFSTPGQEVAGASQGMFTINNGVASRRTSGGVLPYSLTAAASDPRHLLAVTLDNDHPDGIGLLLSSGDGGETWSEGARTTATAFADYDASIILRQTLSEKSIERSFDGGATWSTLLSRSQLEDLVQVPYVWAIAAPEPGRIHLMGSFAGMLSSYDDGQTWQLAEDFRLGSSAFWRIAIDPFDLSHIIAHRQDSSAVGESRDAGRSWDVASFDVETDATVRSLAFDPNVRNRMYLAGDDGVFRSDDGGQTWEPRNFGFDGQIVYDLVVDPDRPTRMLAGTPVGPYLYERSNRCNVGPTRLCLDADPGDERFQVSLRWQTAQGGGRDGDALPISLAPVGIDRAGLLHFGNPANPEVLIKVLDGCNSNGHFWVFASATTTLGYEMVVRDMAGDVERIYRSSDGQRAATITDTRAFATCDVPRRGPLSSVAASASVAPSRIESAVREASVPSSKGGSCVANPTTLCVDATPGDRRFRVRMAFESAAGGGVAGDAQAFSIAGLGVARGGLLHFGNGRNPEVLFKVLDGCTNNGHFWVFFSAATTLGFELTVEDTQTGEQRTYTNPDGTSADAVADTQAFATCGAL